MSAQEHQHSAQEHPHHTSSDASSDASGHHEEPAEETLAPDESPTPMWLPVIGAVLFFVAFVLIAAS